jgi:alcohol dehydrogenase (cytochrome c)
MAQNAAPAAPAAPAAAAPAAKPAAPKLAPIPKGNFALSVTNERLENALNESQNWITANGNLESWRYSRLNQINRDNVGKLHMAWAMSLGGATDVTGVNGPNVMANPLVDNGMMYAVSEWGRVFKIDVTNPQHGDLLWVSDPAVDHENNASLTRGIALYGENVYNALNDGRLVAINRDTGEIVWDKQVGTTNKFGAVERFLSQPLAADGKIFASNGAGDAGTNGWLVALDPKDGHEIWRWNAIPKPGEPGSETWKDDNHTAWEQGGGGMWTTGSYDKTTKSVIWGVANPTPIYDPQYRPGDNLYTDSTVAVDAETGKLKWYFQYTPNDGWDYDENGVPMVQDVTLNGQKQRIVGHFARNGFYYQLGLSDGKFMSANQYANELNWTTGINAEGKPNEYDPKLAVQTYIPATRTLRGDPNERTCPTWHGGIAMEPPAFNPVKQITYAVGTEGCTIENGGTGLDSKNQMGGRTFTSDLYYGGLTAVDAVSNKVLGKVVNDTEIRSGVLSTAGGVIFTALTNGDIVAYNDETLELLWRFNLGTPLKAPPMTFAVGNKQYIALQSSGLHVHPVRFTDLMHSAYLFVFALDDDDIKAGTTITAAK